MDISDLGPAGARVLWTMLLLSIGAILVGLLVVIGPTAIVCLRARLFLITTSTPSISPVRAPLTAASNIVPAWSDSVPPRVTPVHRSPRLLGRTAWTWVRAAGVLRLWPPAT